MKIVDKQTLRIPLILGIALFAFSIIIYSFFSYFRKTEFNSYLESTGIYRSILVFDDKIDTNRLKNIDQNLKESAYLSRQFTIYDSLGNILYKSNGSIPHLKAELLPKVLKKRIAFEKDGFERIIFSNRENKAKKLFIIEASAYDYSGFDRQEKLLYTLIISSLVLFGIILLLSRFYIRKDLKPIGTIAKRMKSISSKNLHERIPEAALRNEIGQMSTTFNDLLDRLDASYTQQKNFVSYATHELRTPLSILLGNAQVTLMKDRTIPEYKQTVENFQIDINNMINLVNSLLELARMNADAQAVPFKQVRIDELLWEAAETLKLKQKTYKIDIVFENIPEHDEEMTISGNAELLILVFRNLMENACKYSSNQSVIVKIESTNKNIKLRFIDSGVGMSAKEMEHIFEAFYRTEKTKEISGHGVGLPLCKRILEIHQGEIKVKSEIEKGSVFTVSLPIASY